MNYIKSTAISGTKTNKFTERNTNTIKNANVRKLTSIALMTIMVAGGLTFAIPGVEPAQAQVSSNPNLQVSVESMADNTFGPTNIIEIIVDDSDIGDSDDFPPRVTVDDNLITLYQTNTGDWYGYFAHTDIVDSGLIPLSAGADTEATDDDVRYCTTTADGVTTVDATCPLFVEGSTADAAAEDPDVTPDLVRSAPDRFANENGGDKTLYLFNLGDKESTFDVVYHLPNDQTVELTYDDPEAGVSLDRTSYPLNTDVGITVDHMAMNVDPTDTDNWILVDGGDTLYTSASNIIRDETALASALAKAQSDYDIAIAQAVANNGTEVERAIDRIQQRY